MAGNDFFVHPLKKKNRGLRSGKPLLKAGKVIKKDKDGYEVLDDYFGESDADHTLDLHRSSIEFRQPLTEIEDDRSASSQPTPVSHRMTRNRNKASQKSVTSSVSSKVSSISRSNPVAWVQHKNIGRRTGKDIKAGKDIRKGADGFENFEDYWSESDADSIMLSRLEERSRVYSPIVQQKEDVQETQDSESTGKNGTESVQYSDALNNHNITDKTRLEKLSEASIVSSEKHLEDSESVESRESSEEKEEYIKDSKSVKSQELSEENKSTALSEEHVKDSESVKIQELSEEKESMESSEEYREDSEIVEARELSEQKESISFKVHEGNPEDVEARKLSKQKESISSEEHERDSKSVNSEELSKEEESVASSEELIEELDREKSLELFEENESITSSEKLLKESESVKSQELSGEKECYASYEDENSRSPKTENMNGSGDISVEGKREDLDTIESVSEQENIGKVLEDENKTVDKYGLTSEEDEDVIEDGSSHSELQATSKTDRDFTSGGDKGGHEDANDMVSVYQNSINLHSENVKTVSPTISQKLEHVFTTTTGSRSGGLDTSKENSLENSLGTSHSSCSVVINGKEHVSSSSEKEQSSTEQSQIMEKRKRQSTIQRSFIDIDNEVDIVEEFDDELDNRRKSMKNTSRRASSSKTKVKSDQKSNRKSIRKSQSEELNDSKYIAAEEQNFSVKTKGQPNRKMMRKESDNENDVENLEVTHAKVVRTNNRRCKKGVNSGSSIKNTIRTRRKGRKSTKSELIDNDGDDGAVTDISNKSISRSEKLVDKSDLVGEDNHQEVEEISGQTVIEQEMQEIVNEEDLADSENPEVNTSTQNTSKVSVKRDTKRKQRKGNKRKGDNSNNISPPKTRRSNRNVKSSKRKSTKTSPVSEDLMEDDVEMSNIKETKENECESVKAKDSENSYQNEDENLSEETADEVINVNKTNMANQLRNKPEVNKTGMPFASTFMSQTVASMVIGGNQNGSMTEVESYVGVTPSFRTRKRLSYSAALLEREQSKKTKKKSLSKQQRTEDVATEEPNPAVNRQTFVFDSESDASSCNNNLRLRHSATNKRIDSIKKGKKSFEITGTSDSEASTEFLSLIKNVNKKDDTGSKKCSEDDHEFEIVDSFSDENQLVAGDDAQVFFQKSRKRKTKGKSIKLSDSDQDVQRESVDKSSISRAKAAINKDIDDESYNENDIETDIGSGKRSHKSQGKKKKHVDETREGPGLDAEEYFEDGHVYEEQLVDQSVDNSYEEEEKTNKYKKATKKGKKSSRISHPTTKRVTRGRRQSHKLQKVEPAATEKEPKLIVSEDVHEESEGVNHFRQILKEETEKLDSLCHKWEDVNAETADLSEDVRGQLRTVIGQAQLLMDQRFKQFEELVDNCQYKRGDKETTVTDLQGFWDMIYFQVEDVHAKFRGLVKLQDNEWNLSCIQPKKPVTKKKISKQVSKKPLGKSMFAEFKEGLKNKAEAEVQRKTIDFGFFSVQSPVVKRTVHGIGDVPKETPVSRRSISQTRVDTPDNEFPVSILQEEAMKSGVSFRRRRRTILVPDEDNCRKKLDPTSDTEIQQDVQSPVVINDVPEFDDQNDDGNLDSEKHVIHTDEEDNRGKIPNIIRRRSSIKYNPPTEPLDITPIISKTKSKRSKDRRVTISRQVIETSYEVANVTGSSGADQTMNATNSEPVHIFEMTNSSTPQPVQNPDAVKIIHPEPAPEGLRRSKRTRIKTLEGFKGERPIYERRKSGLHVVGIQPSIEWKLKAIERKRREKQLAKKKSQNNRRLSGRRLSVHTEIPSMVNPTSSRELTVYNPDQDQDVVMECIGTQEESWKFGPNQEEPTRADPFFMTRSINHPAFGMGMLQLKGLKEKPVQIVSKGTLLFHVVFGKLLVTIQSSSVILSTHDDFCVPRGNSYSIKNLRKDNAKLSYVLMKYDDQSDTESEDED